MPIFVIVPLAKNIDRLDEAVRGMFDSKDYFKLPEDAGWLVSFDGITKQLTDALDVTGAEGGEPPTVGNAMAVPVTTYYGRGPSELWEWLSWKSGT